MWVLCEICQPECPFSSCKYLQFKPLHERTRRCSQNRPSCAFATSCAVSKAALVCDLKLPLATSGDTDKDERYHECTKVHSDGILRPVRTCQNDTLILRLDCLQHHHAQIYLTWQASRKMAAGQVQVARMTGNPRKKFKMAPMDAPAMPMFGVGTEIGTPQKNQKAGNC